MTVKAVLPSYMNNIMQRYVQMVEATLRTEALLLGEEYYSATPALEWMIRDAKPRKKIGYTRDETEKAFAYAIAYGSSAVTMKAIAEVRLVGSTITGHQPNVVHCDDIERLVEQLMSNAVTSGRISSKATNMFAGIHDMIEVVPVEEATPPRASMAWPASHKGKKGPAPHKPFRK